MCPRLFEIGGFGLPTYGILVAAAFLLGLHLAGKLAKRAGLDATLVTNLGVYIALSAIVGAKLFYFITRWDYYSADWDRLFSLSALQTGGVFYGGLLAALATAYFYTKANGLPWLITADVFAPALAAGHAVGRLGCFAAGCCWGKPTDAPWGVMFTDPLARDLVGTPLGVHLHPTQLYESFGTALIALFLYRRFGRAHTAGTILGWYLLLYSSFRFCVEFYRDHAARPWLFGDTLSATQMVAIVLAIGGAALLLKNRGHAPSVAEQAG